MVLGFWCWEEVEFLQPLTPRGFLFVVDVGNTDVTVPHALSFPLSVSLVEVRDEK